jgi:hypothetical protein
MASLTSSAVKGMTVMNAVLTQFRQTFFARLAGENKSDTPMRQAR